VDNKDARFFSSVDENTGNCAGRIIGLSMKRRELATRASSRGDTTEENTGVTVRIDAFASHSCDAAHVAFGKACDECARTRTEKMARETNLHSIGDGLFERRDTTVYVSNFLFLVIKKRFEPRGATLRAKRWQRGLEFLALQRLGSAAAARRPLGGCGRLAAPGKESTLTKYLVPRLSEFLSNIRVQDLFAEDFYYR
jgi:hypothetical protein